MYKWKNVPQSFSRQFLLLAQRTMKCSEFLSCRLVQALIPEQDDLWLTHLCHREIFSSLWLFSTLLQRNVQPISDVNIVPFQESGLWGTFEVSMYERLSEKLRIPIFTDNLRFCWAIEYTSLGCWYKFENCWFTIENQKLKLWIGLDRKKIKNWNCVLV